MGWNMYIRKCFAICGHREDDNNDHSRAVPAGNAYTDKELEREKMKDKGTLGKLLAGTLLFGLTEGT